MSNIVADFSDSQLVAFIKADERIMGSLQQIELSPEDAVGSDEIRPSIIKLFENHMAEQKRVRREEQEAKKVKSVIAGAALFKSLAGITPEQEQAAAVQEWVVQFRDGQTKQPKPAVDNGEGFTCSMPNGVPCCDKTQRVHAFGIMQQGADGEIAFYGMCQSVVDAFKMVASGGGKRDVLTYMNLTVAQRKVRETNQTIALNRWVYSFAQNRAEEFPVERKNAHDQHYCGLPNGVPCCDKKRLAVRYAAYQGVIYGLCEVAANSYWKCNGDTGSKLVKSTDKLGMIEGIADEQLKDLPVIEWVNDFALSTNTDSPQKNHASDNLNLVCGLPHSAECCDHTQPVARFAVNNGEVYGLCPRASRIFAELSQLHGDPAILRYTSNFDIAAGIAASQRERHGHNAESFDDSTSSANKAKAQADRAAREQKQLDRAKKDNDRRPKPNQGSGDITQAYKKGGGKNGKKQRNK